MKPPSPVVPRRLRDPAPTAGSGARPSSSPLLSPSPASRQSPPPRAAPSQTRRPFRLRRSAPQPTSPPLAPMFVYSTPPCPRPHPDGPRHYFGGPGPPVSRPSSTPTGTPFFSHQGRTARRADPLIFEVGYYTEVAGLGATPAETVINGEALVPNTLRQGPAVHGDGGHM